MTAAECVVAYFDRISEAPDAVRRLRQFVLDLAVRGRLSDQRQDDEPATELLKRIRVQRTHLLSPGEVTTLSPVLDGLFTLPPGWAWTSVGDVCSKTGSGSTPRGGRDAYRDTGVIFLRSQNVHDSGLKLTDVAFIDPATHASMAGTAVKPKDLLLNITGGSIGRCCRVPDYFPEANVSQHVAIIRVAVDGLQEFLHRVILSPYFQAFVVSEQTGAGRGGLPKNRMDGIPIPIPPLAEQHRIVAKVDELMALCDRLEAAQKERERRRDRVVIASVARLGRSTSSETFRQYAHFHLKQLPRLLTNTAHVKHVRDTIVDLAVRGRLVPQNPFVGAPSVMGGQQAATDISVPDNFLPIPIGWTVVTLRSICHSITDGDHLPPPKSPSGIPFLVIGDVRNKRLDFRNSRFVTPDYYESLDDTRRPLMGDLLYTLVGSYGIPVVVRDERPFCVQRHIGIIRPSSVVDVDYLAIAMESGLVFSQAAACATGIAQKQFLFRVSGKSSFRYHPSPSRGASLRKCMSSWPSATASNPS